MTNDEHFYRLILDESSDPIFSFFPDGTYRYVNKAFAAGVQRPLSDIIGRRIWDVFPKEEADKRFAAVKAAFETGQDKVIEVKVEAGGHVSWYLTTARPIPGEDGRPVTVVCVSKNITERKLAEERLSYYATTDELTGVTNRRTGLAIMQKILELSRRSGNTCSLIYGDINDLKMVNDTWGHAEGDQLIIAACDCMRQAIRQMDTLARMGGDEFLILLPECDSDLAERIDRRIDENLERFNQQSHKPWQARISRGMTGCDPGSIESVESLLHRLDDLMYQKKRAAG
jgi:diguanylate cyclase (GGDEF)-like protein/PAS domain S-box-containing protein